MAFQKILKGYAFPVYTVETCPSNLTKWSERSFALNCTESNAYMCVPNENITELLEFCYSLPEIQITKGMWSESMHFFLQYLSFITCCFKKITKFIYRHNETNKMKTKIIKTNIQSKQNESIYFQVSVCFYTNAIPLLIRITAAVSLKGVQAQITEVMKSINVRSFMIHAWRRLIMYMNM